MSEILWRPGMAPPVTYRENYDQIAQTHLGSVRAGQGNPWMSAADLEHFSRETASLIERYTAEGGAVLDAGCGIGELERVLDCDRFDVTGIDISADYIAHNREQNRRVTWEVGEIERMPYIDECFDTVVAVDVLEHVLHLDDAIRELLRVLKPDGHVIVRVPLEDSVGGYLYPNPFWYVHMRRFEEAELLLMFTRAFGCEVLETPLCPRVDGSPPPDIHCVARKSSTA